MSSEEKVRVTVEFKGERRVLEAKSAMVVTSRGDLDGASMCAGSFDAQDVVNLAYGAPEVVLKAAGRVGLSPRAANGLILDGVRRAAYDVSAEETFYVDFDARDEIVSIAEDLGVDADV